MPPTSRITAAAAVRLPSAASSTAAAAARTTPDTSNVSRWLTAMIETFTDPPTTTAYTGNDHRGCSNAVTANAPAARPITAGTTPTTRNDSRSGVIPSVPWTSPARIGNPGRSAFGWRIGTDDRPSSPRAATRFARHTYLPVSYPRGIAYRRAT